MTAAAWQTTTECADVSQIRGTDPQNGICKVCRHTACTYRKPCDICRINLLLTTGPGQVKP